MIKALWLDECGVLIILYSLRLRFANVWILNALWIIMFFFKSRRPVSLVQMSCCDNSLVCATWASSHDLHSQYSKSFSFRRSRAKLNRKCDATPCRVNVRRLRRIGQWRLCRRFVVHIDSTYNRPKWASAIFCRNGEHYSFKTVI
jgi:hypothetical protein